MNALRICAELTQLVAGLTRIAAVAFLILYLLWQSVTHPPSDKGPYRHVGYADARRDRQRGARL